MPPIAPLFVGTANRVHAVDRQTGKVIWSVTLDSGFFKAGSSFVTLEYDGTQLFAFAYAELYCLDPATGQVRWRTPLKGGGYGPASFASSAPVLAAVTETIRSEEATTT